MRLAFLFLFFPSVTFAFMNIESIRQNAKDGTSGAISAKLNGASGNSEKFSAELTSLTLVRVGFDEYLAAGKYRYGESRHVKDAHDANAHLRYTRDLDDRLAAEFFLQSEFDEFKRLKRRDLVGSGLRILLDRKESNALYLGPGFFYEHEDFDHTVSSEETMRGSIYLSYVRTFSEHVSGNAIIYYQPSIEGIADTRVQFNSGLQVHLTAKLSLSLEFDLQYDSEPAPGVTQTDTSYLTGLTYAY